MSKTQKDPTKHHFVPRSILRNFSDPNGCLWVYDAESNRKWQSIPDAAGFENDLYTVTRNAGGKDKKTIEDLVTNLFDTPGADAIRGLLNRECLDMARWTSFLGFVAAQMMRTPKAIRQIKELEAPVMTEKATRMAVNPEFRERVASRLLLASATPSQIKRILSDFSNGRIQVTPTQEWALLTGLSQVSSIVSIIREMGWMFFSVAESDPDLIIGDHPVSLEDIGVRSERAPLGLLNQNIEIILPLSKRMAAVARHSCESTYGTLLSGMSSIINERTMRFAGRFVYGSIDSEEILQKAVSLLDKGPKLRTNKIQIGEKTAFVMEFL